MHSSVLTGSQCHLNDDCFAPCQQHTQARSRAAAALLQHSTVKRLLECHPRSVPNMPKTRTMRALKIAFLARIFRQP